MAGNYAAQRDAFIDLSVAYMGARDFTLPVLRRAFGDPPPPPDKCVWPPPGITEMEARSRLLSVQSFLEQSTGVLRVVLRDIKAAQVGLAASGFDVPRSWIIADPLNTFRGGMHGAPGCSVPEIVQSATAEDAGLEKVLGRISVGLVKLEGKVAGSESEERTSATKLEQREQVSPGADTGGSGGNGGANSTTEQPATDPNVKRKEVLEGLKPADRKAYLSFVYAESKVGKRLEDHDAHKWLTENGIDTDKGDLGQLADYKLPVFDTWSRQLRNARNPLGEQKYTRRAGRAAGRSIVSGREIEYQNREAP